MKKTVSGILLALASVFALVACGDDTTKKPDNSDSSDTTASTASTAAPKSKYGEGMVINFRCWNTEFQGRLRAFYPFYEKTDKDGNDILKDGTKIVWNIVPSDNLAYQNALDTALAGQAAAAANDKVDMFLIEADYALKYAASSNTLDLVADLGFKATDFDNQFNYTKQIVTADGKLKGSSWQAAPGLFAYRQDYAELIFEQEDITPAEVQEEIDTWEKFDAVAAKAKADQGLCMLAGYDDAYRAFTNTITTPMVKDGVLTIPQALWDYVDMTAEYTEKDYNFGYSLWAGDWGAQMTQEGETFGFFWSTWGINFSLIEKAGAAGSGNWRVTEGPASYYWGGTWICAANGTDNKKYAKNIIEYFTLDDVLMQDFTTDTLDFTNNKRAMKELADDPDYGAEYLGGQNHIALFYDAANEINMGNCTKYDQGITEKFQAAMKTYFDGIADPAKAVTLSDAFDSFKEAFIILYPEFAADGKIVAGRTF